ncbi:MAG: GlxA family transcriptional regulator [Pseudomonadota bacterium]
MPLQSGQQSFAFITVPSYSLLALASAIDGLRAANVVLERKGYIWGIFSAHNDAALGQASCGLSLQSRPLIEAADADVLVVCGGDQSHNFENPALTNILRAAKKRGAKIGALSEASFILAAAGLFNGRRSTIHWKCQHAYRERFPDLDIRSSLFEIDGPVFSCVGGTSALDLILNMVIADHGADVASLVAENYHHDAIRTQDQRQKMSTVLKHAGSSPDLIRALYLMEANIEEPLSIQILCQRLSLSNRHLDRVFKRYLGAGPQAFYRKIRLERAAQLLSQTSLTVSSIAVACGFSSSSHLSKFFHRDYGVAPMAYRTASQEGAR